MSDPEGTVSYVFMSPDVSQSTFLKLSASFFFPTSCCLLSGITLKIVAFYLEASLLCCSVHSRKGTLELFFPPSVTPLSTMLWSRAIIYPEEGKFLNVTWSGYV